MNDSINNQTVLHQLTSDCVITSIVLTTFVVGVGTATLVLNLTLITIIVSTKSLRRCANYLIISLAGSETINGGTMLTFAALSQSELVNDSSVDQICSCVSFGTSLGRSSATLVLMMIAIERCIAISKPLAYSRLITTKRIVLSLSILWLLSIGFTLLSFTVIKSKYKLNGIRTMCVQNDKLDKNIVRAHVTMLFILPLIVTYSCIIVIFREAKLRHRVFAMAVLPLAMTSNITQNVWFNKTTKKALRSLTCIATIYFLLHIPRVSLLLFETSTENIRDDVNNVISLTSQVCESTCCIVTSLMITIFNGTYRARFCELCCYCKTKSLQTLDVSSSFAVVSGLRQAMDTTIAVGRVQEGSNRHYERAIRFSKAKSEYNAYC